VTVWRPTADTKLRSRQKLGHKNKEGQLLGWPSLGGVRREQRAARRFSELPLGWYCNFLMNRVKQCSQKTSALGLMRDEQALYLPLSARWISLSLCNRQTRFKILYLDGFGVRRDYWLSCHSKSAVSATNPGPNAAISPRSPLLGFREV
jgi:hypothetical protein